MSGLNSVDEVKEVTKGALICSVHTIVVCERCFV